MGIAVFGMFALILLVAGVGFGLVVCGANAHTPGTRPCAKCVVFHAAGFIVLILACVLVCLFLK